MMGIRYVRPLFPVLLILSGCLQQPEQGQPRSGITPREAVYSRLSSEGKARVDNGDLVFTGTGFVVPPTILPRPIGDYREEFSPLGHISDWLCPLANPEGDKRDHGTFLLYGTYNGDTTPGVDRPLNFGSASFILPAASSIRMGPGETPYAMFGGWAPDGSNTAFDAGFGWQQPDSGETRSSSSGWFFFTSRYVGGVSTMRARKYRLLNIYNSDAAVTADFTMLIDRDGHLEATATATGSTRWVNPYLADDPRTAENEAVLTDPATGQPILALTLGGSEEGFDENDGEGPLPVQHVPGFDQSGHDNVFSLQIALATFDYTDPSRGSFARGIGIYDLEVGFLAAPGQVPDTDPWDIRTSLVTLFDTKCPESNWRNAYDLNDGNTASTTAAGAFTVDIDIAKDNVHSLPDIPEPDHNAAERGWGVRWARVTRSLSRLTVAGLDSPHEGGGVA